MKPIQLSAAIRLNAEHNGKRRFEILAYTGGKLHISGFGLPVVVDLSGLEVPESIPILMDHKATVETTLGYTQGVANDGRQLVLSGDVTGKSQQVMDVITMADSGHSWQASIGCLVEATQEIPEGVSVTVNGQSFTGPIIVARQSVLRETSVLPMGADSSTKVNLAATANLKGNGTMTFEEWLAENGFDEATLSSEGKAILQQAYDTAQASEENPEANAGALIGLRASRAADHLRIAKIESLTVKHPLIAAAAIRSGWTPERTELEVLKASQRKTAPSTFIGGNSQDAPDGAQVLAASFALTAGASQNYLAKSYGQTVVDAATRVEARGATLRTVCDFVLQAAGMPQQSNRITDSYIRAAFEASRKLEASGLSTMSLPGILSNAANKLLLEGYDSVATTWQEFCCEGNLADFKEATRYRMIATGEFEELPPGGLIKHLVLNKEQQYTNQAKTFAKMVALDRQDIINDDLSAFDALPQSLGRLAVMQLEKQVYKLLLGNAGSFFHADNNNLLTGGGSALSINALTAAEAAFLDRTDDNGDPVMLNPQLLLVPTALSVPANQLVRDTQVVAVGVGDTAAVQTSGNPHAGRFTALTSPFLSNAKLTGYSSDAWYLIARPQGSSGLIEVGFLNGQKTPTIESGELDFNQLGLALRGYWDFGVAFQDGRYGVRNAGA